MITTLVYYEALLASSYILGRTSTCNSTDNQSSCNMLLSPMNPSAFQPTLPSLHQSYVDPLEHHMPASKRPKLSLQTSLPSAPYGVSSSQAGSNRADSVATPTTRNTLANQYHTFDLSIRPSPVSATASPAGAPFPKPAPISRNKRSLPYDLNLPIGVRSILKNSAIPTDVRRGSLSAASASPRSATGGRRIFFPEPKRVKFGTDEEIVTSTYVARHVDLSSSEDEASSSGSDSGATQVQAGEEDPADAPSTNILASRSGQAVIVDELQRGRSTTQPINQKRTSKKKRRWEWTLGDAGATERQHWPEMPAATDEPPSPSSVSSSSSPSIATPSTYSGGVEAKPQHEVTVEEQKGGEEETTVRIAQTDRQTDLPETPSLQL